jgi:HEAT repeat protein
MLSAPNQPRTRVTLQTLQSTLRRIGPAAAPELAKLLVAEDAAVRRAAAEALQNFGGDARSALPALEKAAADEDATVRRVAARAAFQAGSRSAAVVRALADGLTASEVNQRREAAQLVSGFWPLPDPVLDGLKKALDDSDGLVRVHAAAALARSDSSAQDAAPVLAAALKDPATQWAAVNAVTAPNVKLAVLKAAVPGLRDVFKNPQARQGGYLAGRAGLGLVRAGVPDAIELLTEAATAARPRGTATGYLQALAECGPEGAAAIRKLAEHDDPSVRLSALHHIAQMARTDRELVPVLAARLKDQDVNVRLRALSALGAVGPTAESAAEAVAALLRDPNPPIRLEAAVAVAHIGSTTGREEALKLLLDSLHSRGPQPVSPRALDAVGRFGADAAPAIPALVKLINGRVPSIRAAAVEALGGIGKPAKEAVPALMSLLKSGDGLTKAHAAVALWQITGESKGLVPTLTAALDDSALRRPTFAPPPPYYPPPQPLSPPTNFPSQVSLPPRQTTYYYTPPYRSGTDALLAVIRTLGEIGPEAKSAAEALRRAGKDTEPEVAKAVADALKRIELN